MASEKYPTQKKSAGIILFIIIGVLLIAYIKNKSCKYLDCISFQGSEKFKTADVYETQKNTYRALFSDDKSQLRVDIRSKLSKDQAETQTNIAITNMKKIFEKERAPYPGEISETVVCDESFIPKWQQRQVNGLTVDYTEAFLNERYVYGACTGEQVKYKSLMFLFYCPGVQKLYQLELIQPPATQDENYYDSVINSLSCNK